MLPTKIEEFLSSEKPLVKIKAYIDYFDNKKEKEDRPLSPEELAFERWGIALTLCSAMPKLYTANKDLFRRGCHVLMKSLPGENDKRTREVNLFTLYRSMTETDDIYYNESELYFKAKAFFKNLISDPDFGRDAAMYEKWMSLAIESLDNSTDTSEISCEDE